MGVAKVAISMDQTLLKKIDQLVEEKKFQSRSQVIQLALQDKIAKIEKHRLATACEALNPEYEQKLADEGLSEDMRAWPEF